jgi:hypothetical protein
MNLVGLLPEPVFLGQDMRIRITESLKGSIDGIQLDRFRVGETYDMGTTLASYLMAVGAAVPIMDESPGRLVALDADWSGSAFETVAPADDRDSRH